MCGLRGRAVSKVFRDFSPGWLGEIDSRIKSREDRRSASVEGRRVNPILGVFSLKYWSDFSVYQTTGNERVTGKKLDMHSHESELLNSWNGMRFPKKSGEKQAEDRTSVRGRNDNKGRVDKEPDSPTLEVKELGPSSSLSQVQWLVTLVVPSESYFPSTQAWPVPVTCSNQ